MRFSTFFLIPAVSALAISQRDDRARAAYFLYDDPAGASVVSLKIDVNDGSLSNPVMTSTRGKGLQGLFTQKAGPPAPGNFGELP